MKCLSDNIRRNGILQPLSVAPLQDGTYRLLAGERRLRSARIAGLEKIPCIIIETSEEKIAMFSLLENIQRKELNFFEQAEGIKRIMDTYCVTQEEIAKQLGKKPSAVSNLLRLLTLPEDVQNCIIEYDLTESHARCLLKLNTEQQIFKAVNIIISSNLNVFQTESLVDKMLHTIVNPYIPQQPQKEPIMLFKDVRVFVNTIKHAVDTMQKSGINANSEKFETDNYIQFTIKIPKNTTHVIGSQVNA
ncbi:Nucleoid occlusion protein [bioreactor metagenome]|uniref:Nucleoid occlusion protein n=1 Tax=bioreactor metagenome TaxID=1076179 RepID=A0A645EWS1_9ZZZZ